MNDLYAFWRYDVFPFVRWGQIKDIHEDGSVEVVDCPGLRVTPLLVLPKAHAEKAIAQIQALEPAYQAEITALTAKYKGTLRRIVPALV